MTERVRSAVSIVVLVAIGVLTNLDLSTQKSPSEPASLMSVSR